MPVGPPAPASPSFLPNSLHYGSTTALGLWRRGLFKATCTLTRPVAPLLSPGCLRHPGGLSWSISSSRANCPSSHHALVSSCGSVPVQSVFVVGKKKGKEFYFVIERDCLEQPKFKGRDPPALSCSVCYKMDLNQKSTWKEK